MGKVVHLAAVREFVAKTPVFRARDVELIVKDRPYTLLLLHNLVRKGEVRRIVKGWYTTRVDPALAVLAFRPAYLGLQQALSLRDLWEQETTVVIVTCISVRPGIREIMGSNAVLHRINAKYFFGFDYLDYGGIAMPVSDVEKTLIDLVYYRELPGADVLRKLAKEADESKLRDYLLRYPTGFRSAFKRAVS